MFNVIRRLNNDLATTTTMNPVTVIGFADIDQIRLLINRIRVAGGGALPVQEPGFTQPYSEWAKLCGLMKARRRSLTLQALDGNK